MVYKNLVLSGGGIKGYSYIGVFKALNEKDMIKDINHIVGTSAGSLFGILLCLKFTYEEIYKIMKNIDIKNKININNPDLDIISNLFENFGIENTLQFERIYKIFIKRKFNKTNITFKELYDETNIKFTIVTTNVSKNQTEYFNVDLTPDVDILLALQMSISIPFFFNPIIYNNNYYVDGALTNNFAIDYFEKDINETLGVSIFSKDEEDIESLDTYIYRILQCNFNYIDKKKIDKYKDNVVILESNINILDFNISDEKKDELINEGYNKTISHLRNLE